MCLEIVQQFDSPFDRVINEWIKHAEIKMNLLEIKTILSEGEIPASSINPIIEALALGVLRETHRIREGNSSRSAK